MQHLRAIFRPIHLSIHVAVACCLSIQSCSNYRPYFLVIYSFILAARVSQQPIHTCRTCRSYFHHPPTHVTLTNHPPIQSCHIYKPPLPIQSCHTYQPPGHSVMPHLPTTPTNLVMQHLPTTPTNLVIPNLPATPSNPVSHTHKPSPPIQSCHIYQPPLPI